MGLLQGSPSHSGRRGGPAAEREQVLARQEIGASSENCAFDRRDPAQSTSGTPEMCDGRRRRCAVTGALLTSREAAPCPGKVVANQVSRISLSISIFGWPAMVCEIGRASCRERV